MRLAKTVLAGSMLAVISSVTLAQQAPLTGTVTMVDRISGTVTIQQTQSGTVGAERRRRWPNSSRYKPAC